jgi:hypothetical protein
MIYLSTPSTDTMIVDVFKGNSTTASWTLTISKSTTTANSSFDPGSMSNSDYNDVTFIQDSKSATVLNNAGLRLQSRSGEQFYVTFRARWNSSHASSLTSKGRAALGTSFRWVGAPNRGGSLNRLSNSIGIMATEDNTQVDIFGYDPACTFRSSTSETGVTNDNLTFTLNRGGNICSRVFRQYTRWNQFKWLDRFHHTVY